MYTRYVCHEKPGYIACLIAIEISTSHTLGCLYPFNPFQRYFIYHSPHYPTAREYDCIQGLSFMFVLHSVFMYFNEVP
ncbi:hypothetical protein Hanom_Chr12g01164511 [Helianthus anomalus]